MGQSLSPSALCVSSFLVPLPSLPFHRCESKRHSLINAPAAMAQSSQNNTKHKPGSKRTVALKKVGRTVTTVSKCSSKSGAPQPKHSNGELSTCLSPFQ